jgi:outer membrane protein assembly factor BamB
MTRRRWLILIAALLLLGAGAAAAAFVVWKQRNPGSIRGSASTEFDTSETPGATTRPEAELAEIPWPTFGYDNARTRFASEFDHRPPYRQVWMVRGRALIEFPPVVGYGRLYVANIKGRFMAIDRERGKIDWQKRFDRCAAASPAIGDGVVYQALMDPLPCDENDESDAGFLVAMDAETGQELWRFRAGVIESPPLLVDGTLYFGSWDRKLYALDAETHRVKWTFATGDQIKDSPAYSKGTIYFGSYDGKVYALDAKTGKERWAASGVANFYASPAVAYGRVYIGNTDGRVYAFGAKSGNLLWARATGDYVYSSAAVWERAVFAGSYDGHFYSFDAATGDVRWSFDSKGEISGSPVVMNGLVYFSTLRNRTFALDARNGRKVWEFPDGEYNPLVADEERVYLIGEKRIYGVEPRA